MSDSLVMCFLVAHRQIVHMVYYINAASVVFIGVISLVYIYICIYIGRCNVPIALSCIMSNFYCNLLIYSRVQVCCHFMND